MNGIVGWTFMSTGPEPKSRENGKWTFMSTGPEPKSRENGKWTFLSTGPNSEIRVNGKRFLFAEWWRTKQRRGGHECPPYGGLR